MPMREQPDGVRRTRRGKPDGKPAAAYDIFVDEQYAGWVERLHPHRKGSAWRIYPEIRGVWPRKFDRPGGYLAGVEWLTTEFRAAKQTAEPVTVAEDASVRVLSPVVSDPFRAEPFADPLAP